jgi:hypothetical protein
LLALPTKITERCIVRYCRSRTAANRLVISASESPFRAKK